MLADVAVIFPKILPKHTTQNLFPNLMNNHCDLSPGNKLVVGRTPGNCVVVPGLWGLSVTRIAIPGPIYQIQILWRHHKSRPLGNENRNRIEQENSTRTSKIKPTIVVPVLRKDGGLNPLLESISFLLQWSKLNPPFIGTSTAAWDILQYIARPNT